MLLYSVTETSGTLFNQPFYGRTEATMRNKLLDAAALTIAIIGAVNWGLIGFFDFDLVAFLFGSMSWISRIVYALVGLSGLYLLTFYLYLSDNPIPERQ